MSKGKSVMTSVSFKEFYYEQLVYLELQHSKSNFICELIKKHMEENGVSIPQEEIDKYIEAKQNKRKCTVKIDMEFKEDDNIPNTTQPTSKAKQSVEETTRKKRDVSWL